MTRKIVYIDENENPVDKSVFLELYKERGIDTDSILQLIDRLDYAGGFQLSEEEYLRALQRLPREARLFLGDSTNINSGIAYLRGREYYLHITFDDDIERTRQRVIENTQRLQELIPEIFRTDSKFSLEEKIAVSSILDHKKHYSLAFLVGLYNHMLLDPDFDVDVYKKFREVCEKDISNYYRFLLSGESPKIEILEGIELTHMLYINLPKATLRESEARRLILREMDHPGQLILYSGNLLARDGDKKIDVIINPLAGAAEIGYALRTIFISFGMDKIRDIHFIRYSPYGERHGDPIMLEDITKYVPIVLINELGGIIGKRVFVIDDNAFSGGSVRAIKNFLLQNYSNEVSIAVIERPIDLPKTDKNRRYIEPAELDIPVISKWRSIDRIEEEIKRYNFGGKYDQKRKA